MFDINKDFRNDHLPEETDETSTKTPNNYFLTFRKGILNKC